MYRDQLRLSLRLISFLSDYCRLMSDQLDQSSETISSTVHDLNALVRETSEHAEKFSSDSSDALMKAYFSEEEGMKGLIERAQTSTTNIVEGTQDLGNEGSEVSETAVDKKLRRFASQFHKHMEAVVNLDEKINEELIHVMGHLSTDDVFNQRVDHITAWIQAMHSALTTFIMNGKKKTDEKSFRNLRRILLNLAKEFCGTEKELKIYTEILEKWEKAA